MLLLAPLLLMFAAGPALAQNLEAMQLANELGALLAAEEHCGLSFDQAAIERFMAEQPAAADLSFPQNLVLMTQGQSYMLEAQTSSQKVAHCAAVKAAARKAGFLPD